MSRDWKSKFNFKHQCDLPQNQQDDFSPSPYAPQIYKFCYKLQRYFTVHPSQESRTFFRSTASLRQERLRHLGNKAYRRVIHPFSYFARRKRMLCFLLWFTGLILDPFAGSFLISAPLSPFARALYFIHSVSQLLLIFDMACRFRVGYVIDKTREVVLDPKKITRQYIHTYFVVDLFANMISLVVLFWPWLTATQYFLVSELRMIRVFRFKRLLANFEKTMKMINVQESIRLCIILFTVSFLVIHWWTCALGHVPLLQDTFGLNKNDTWLMQLKEMRTRYEQKNNVLQDYLQHMAVVVCHFFGAGYTRYYISNSFEMTVLSITLISGLSFYTCILSKIVMHFGSVNIAESKYEELIVQSKNFMMNNKYPRSLRKRVQKYYEYKYDRTFFSEQEILSQMSEHLRYEILLYSCERLIEKVQVFKGLSRPAVGCILSRLEQEIYLSGDVIMISEQMNGTLYFILYGTCAVELMSGKEAVHIEDGDNFGEIDEFHMKKDIPYKVVAVETCQIYKLSTSDIHYCCTSYPEIKYRLEAMGASKAKFYNAILATASTEDEIGVMDIIAELRRGNILEQGMRRERLTAVV